MLYQVLVRVSAQETWEPYRAMTRDPLHAITLLRQASRRFAEVTIIQAESAQALREQAQRLRAGEPTGHETSPTPSLTATPRISPLGDGIESQRWAFEQGPGGDHDVPYHFEPPTSDHALHLWAHLTAMAQRREAESIAAQAESCPDPADASAIDTASSRSERVS